MAMARIRLVALLLTLLNLAIIVANAVTAPSSRQLVSRSHRRMLLSSRQNANTTTTTDLLSALRKAKLNKLAALLDANQAVLQEVDASPGLKTLLAPVDDALPLPSWSNTSAVLLYHFLNGTIGLDDYPTLPQHAVVHSFLTASSGANLPGGNGQAVALSTGETHGTYNDDTREVNEAINVDMFEKNGAIEQSTLRVGSYTILPIRRAMTIPGNATYTTRNVVKHSAFANALQQIQSTTDSLDDMRGLTMFVPSNEALATFRKQHSSISNDTVQAVLRNHLVAYRAVYSALLTPDASLITMGGQDMHITNSTARMRVAVGNVSATITQTDVMHYGGVIHLIDTVLFDTSYDEQRAARAAASAQASANSFVAGVVSISNAASSQGTDVPPSPAGSVGPTAQNSTVTNTHDAKNAPNNAISNGQPSTSGGQRSNASTSYASNMPAVLSVTMLTVAVMVAILVAHP